MIVKPELRISSATWRARAGRRSGPAVRLLLAATLTVAAAPAVAPAPAGPARTAWSTYLRTGPGDAYEAVSEIEHDTRVEVGACGDRWCRVSDGAVSGYVDRDALVLPRTPAPSPPARRNCARVAQADDHGRVGVRFCSADTPAR